MRRFAFVLVGSVVACARTGLLDFTDDGSGGSGPTPPPECVTVFDCAVTDPCAPPVCLPYGDDGALRCIPSPVDCTDLDACTLDRCDPATGACLHEGPRDADRDGYLGEVPEGVPASCGGTDCDDEDVTVHPGGIEICDGRDNDCNGGVDDNLAYTTVDVAPRAIAPVERDRAAHGGLVWNGQTYGVSYSTTAGHKQSFFKLLTRDGADASAEVEISQINADAYAGPIDWSGSSFFTAFADARQSGNYEVYAARFRSDGFKIQDSEIRVTDAPDFSLNPAVVWTGDEYVVAWDDRRGRIDGGFPQIYGRRFSETGAALGAETQISAPGDAGETPVLAVGDRTVGLAYVALNGGTSRLRFRALDLALGSPGPVIDLPRSDDATTPSIAFAAGRYFVAWAFTHDESQPGSAIHVAVIDEATNVLSGGDAVTAGFAFARFPSLVSLGDRAFLVFSGAGAAGAYDLYAMVVPPSLGIFPAVQLTQTQAQSFLPYAARGPAGTIGIVFDEDAQTPPTSRRPYFMAVGCRDSGPR